MSIRRGVGIVVLFACVPKTLRFEASGATTLSFTSLTPALVHVGDTLNVVASATDAIASCTVSVAGLGGVCTTSGNICTCTFVVTPATPEGAIDVTVSARAGGDTPQVTASVQVDRSGPVVTQADVAIERQAMGQQDDLLINPGGLTEPPPVYAAQKIASVLVWTSASGGTATSVAAPDLSQPLRIPIGTGSVAPPQVWLSAIDAAGNESPRTEIVAGRDLDPPLIDGTQITLTILPALVDDSVAAAAGALSDATSQLAGAAVYAESTSTTPLASAVPVAGGFAAVDIGDLAAPHVFITATDKCGNTSAMTPAKTGSITLTTEHRVRHSDVPLTLVYYPLVRSAVLGTSDSNDAGLDTWWPFVATDEGSDAQNAALASADGQGTAWSVASFPPEPFGNPPTQPWTPLYTSGPPEAQGVFGMVHDSARGVDIIFGGTPDQNNTLLHDTWEYCPLANAYCPTANSWQSISGPSPSGRFGMAMAYDPVRAKTVLFGGTDGVSYLSDTWEYDASGWRQMAPLTSPNGRLDASMAYLPTRRQLIMFGGSSSVENCDGGVEPFACNSTWTYDGTTWTRLVTAHAPSPRITPAMNANLQLGQITLFGGTSISVNSSACPLPNGPSGGCQDTWQFDGFDWYLLDTAAPPPPGIGQTFDAATTLAYDLVSRFQIATDPQPRQPPGTNGTGLTSVTTFGATAWNTSPPTTSGVALAIAGSVYDTALGAVVGFNADPQGVVDMYVYNNGSANPTSAMAADLFHAQIEPGALVTDLSYTYVGDGSGMVQSTGALGNHVSISIWSWTTQSWLELACAANPTNRHCAVDAGTGAPFLVALPLVVAPGLFSASTALDGSLWFLAEGASSDTAPAPAGPSAINTDMFQVTISYQLP